MPEKAKVFYCLTIGRFAENVHCGDWFKEVDLPLMLPVGTTIWVYAMESAHSGPYFPVEITGYEHWMRGREDGKDGHIRINMRFTGDDLERNGGVDAIAKVLESEGWEREPNLSI